MDQLLREPCELSEALRVADDAVVVPDALQLALEFGDKFGKRQASQSLEPFLERGQSGSELLGVGLASHSPIFGVVLALSPIEVEAEEGELPAAFSSPPVGSAPD